MQNYVYRIQERKYSSNIIERGYYISDKLKHEPFICPVINKKEGDIICNNLLEILKNDNRKSI